MPGEEKKDINAIMNKLLKKQQEINEIKTRDAETEKEATFEPVVNNMEQKKAEDDTTPVDAFGQDETEEVPAKEAEDEAAHDRASAVTNEDIYASLIEDVMASDSGKSDEAEIAARVNELYNEYVSNADKAAAEAESKEAPALDVDGLIDDYFKAEEPAKTEIPAEEQDSAVDSVKTENTAEDNTAEPEKSPATQDEDVLMQALGYKEVPKEQKKNAQAQKPARNGGKITSDLSCAFAYDGKEYKSKSQRGEILGSYDREQTFMFVRIAGTVLFAILCLLFDIFGSKLGGFLSAEKYPVVNIMVSLQLLLCCAFFSGEKIWQGLRGLAKAQPVNASVTAVSLLAAVAYNAILAISVKPGESFALYSSPAAFCLCFQVAADYLKLLFEKRNFEKLSSFEELCTLEKVHDTDSVYRLRRGSFSRGYFKNTNRYNGDYTVENYILAAIVAAGIIMFIIFIALGEGLIAGLGAFIRTVGIGLPVFSILALDVPFYITNMSRSAEPAVILHPSYAGDYSKIKKIVLDETDMFSGGKLEIVHVTPVSYSDADLYSVLSSVSSVCDAVGGTISHAFEVMAAETDGSADANLSQVVINRVCDGGIDANVGDKHYVLGSLRFLIQNGIPCVGCDDKDYQTQNPDTVIFHIAVDNKEVFRMYIRYTPDPAFEDMVTGLSERGIETELHCIDPNLSSGFVVSLIGKPDVALSVVRSEWNESDDDTQDGSFDAGLVADGRDWMSAVSAAETCRSFCRAADRNLKLSLLVEVLVFILGLVLGVFVPALSPLYLLIIYIVTLLPSVVISKLN